MRALPLLLLASLLAGCVSQSVQPQGLGQDPFADVAAGLGGKLTRTAEGMAIAWSGQLGPSFSYPLLLPPQQTVAGVRHPFTLGPGIGTINATVAGTGFLSVAVRDDRGLLLCSADGSAGASCEEQAPPWLTQRAQWSVLVFGNPQLAPSASQDYTVTLRLRPGPHAALGDLEAGLARVGDVALLDTAHFGGEPTMGVARSGALFTIALNNTSFAPVVLRSKDQGATWEELRPPTNDVIGFDPFLYLDARTNRLVVSNLRPDLQCSFLSWSDDEGATWISHPNACIAPLEDHQKLTIGGHPALPPPLGFDGTMYYSDNSPWLNSADQRASELWVSRSLDGGLTWQPSVAATGLDGRYRTGGPIMADLAGNVYVPLALRDVEGGGMDVAFSHDFGAAWQRVHAAPDGPGSWGVDGDIALDDAGNVYLVYESRDHSVKVAVSKDHGATWGEPFRVPPPAIGSVRLAAGIAGAPGKLAIAYLGTPDSAKDSNLVPPWTRWHLYL
ncbi:MAG: glycoside hydrolase, partial [Halobacteriales archaeon]|nr:glycoside hydrolase [Halobacteriales archaeon]